jgi:4,5-dihydroxyphthalate decarboxylase
MARRKAASKRKTAAAKRKAAPKRTASRKSAAAKTPARRATKDLKLSFATGPYDRMEALWTGEVKPKGIALEFTRVEQPHALFDMVLDEGKFDAAEFGISTTIAHAVTGDRSFVHLPIFPSKMFRHSYIFINRRGPIKEPKDLAGRRIGCPNYPQVAAIWCRGHLMHEYGADLSDVTWVQGSIDHAGTHGSGLRPVTVHKPVKLEKARPDKSLQQLLIDGEIDAIVGASRPSMYGKHPDLARIFPDPRKEEREFYARTGIHPIMHDVVIRRSVYDKNPWIAQSLYDACEEAKARADKKLRYGGAQRVMLPWLADDMEEIDRLWGSKPWAYGVEPNRKTLETLIQYMEEQGVIPSRPRVDDLFVSV